MTRRMTDVGASVRARLLRLARARGEDFQLVLTRYANERLLFRLANSRHSSQFVLKGAALFTLWTGKPHRATRDLDLLGFGDASEKAIRAIFSDILTADAGDGVTFELASLKVAPIRGEQEYGGVRVVVSARIAAAKVRLQVDVGVGDAITPEPAVLEFPALLEFPAPRLRTYPRETVVAEKLEAMATLGLANSRMKDFYDVVLLSRLFDFDGDLLARAIRATFDRRRTPLPAGLPVALTPAFSENAAKRTQWSAFIRKSGGENIGTFAEAVSVIAAFLERPLNAAVNRRALAVHWRPGGPWE